MFHHVSLETNLGPMTASAASGARAQGLDRGYHKVALKLTDAKGKKLANGVYYVVVTTEKGKAVGKMIVMR